MTCCTVYNAINNHDHNASAEVYLSGPVMLWSFIEWKKVLYFLINEQTEKNKIA